MKEPGPDHPITLTPNPKRMRVRFQGHVIGDTTEAITLQEADYPPVEYFPRAALETGFMSKTAATSHCPYKGDATYYSLYMDGDLVEKAAWSYETPYPAMEAIAGLIAFYPDKVEIYSVDEADGHHRPAFAAAWPDAQSGAQ